MIPRSRAVRLTYVAPIAPARRWALSCALVLGMGGLAPARVEADPPALATTSDREAERAFEALRLAADDRGVEELARRFLLRFPRDPLVPRAELLLGRAIVLAERASLDENGMGEVDESRVRESIAILERCEAHADAPTIDRAQLHRGLALSLLGDEDEAVALLEPLGPRLVDPGDRDVQRRTLLFTCRDARRADCALRALDAMRADCGDPPSCQAIDDRIHELARTALDDEAAIAFAQRESPTRASYGAIASRAIRAAAAAADWDVVRAIATRAAEADVELDAESREIARRLENGLDAEPRVVGVVVGLTGADAEDSMAVVEALARAAGLPIAGPPRPDAFRIVVRDHRGDPDEARAAVSELFWLHRAIAIIGPLDAPSADAASDRAEGLGMPFLSLAPVPTRTYVIDAAPATSGSWLEAEAARRFGEGVALVVPAGARGVVPDDPARFVHAGGRFDVATRTRLRRTEAPALVLNGRPAELARLLRSCAAELRGRPAARRPALVIDHATFARARDAGRSLEGVVVLERVALGTNEGAPAEASRTASAELASSVASRAAARAFERIVDADASTRAALAARLAQPTAPARESVRAFVVRRGRLVALP